MDREIFATRQELDELEQARICFADHLEKINQLNPDGWNNESLRQDLTRAISVLDLAEDEYEQALAHFSGGRSASVFGPQEANPSVPAQSRKNSDLSTTFVTALHSTFPSSCSGSIAFVVLRSIKIPYG